MIKFLTCFLLISFSAMACPNCGSLSNSFDGNKVIILTAFIISIYIPMYILFKMAMKKGKKTSTDRNIC